MEKVNADRLKTPLTIAKFVNRTVKVKKRDKTRRIYKSQNTNTITNKKETKEIGNEKRRTKNKKNKETKIVVGMKKDLSNEPLKAYTSCDLM